MMADDGASLPTPATAARGARSVASRHLRARALWLEVHSYIALILGAFIALVGLTGAVLAFHPQVDRLLNPQFRVEPPSAPHIPIDTAVAVVERQLGVVPGLVRMPRAGEPYYVVESFDAATGDYRVATIGAASGAILADRVWGRTFVTLLFDLHTGNVLGEPGFIFVGWLAVALLVSSVTGLYLWWPRGGVGLRRALTLRFSRRARPLNLELHRISGVYLAAVLLVLSVTGIYIVFPSVVTPVVGLVGSVTPEPEHVRSERPPPPGARRLPLERILEIVAAHAPGSHIASILLPEDPQEAFSVRYVDRGEPESRYGQSAMWIDQFDGRVLESQPYSRMGTAQRFLALQLPSHSGEILGMPGRTLVCIAGVGTVLMYGTGLYLWWTRRRRRTAAR